MRCNIDSIIQSAAQTVASHKIAAGDYCRWLWQNEKGNRELGSNPYGCADAANILYSIGQFPEDDSERAASVHHLRKFQDPETGLFHERTHHTYHTTAHCAAALELFDKKPLYPLRELAMFDDIRILHDFLRNLEWFYNVWSTSHRGAGVFAAKIICESPSIEWQNAYFDFLTAHCDKKYGMSWEGSVDSGTNLLPHHLNGWFHYLFNFNHCHRPFPEVHTFIDTLIEMYQSGNCQNDVLGRTCGFREVDWVFALNRATAQAGYRREEAKELLRHFTAIFLDFLGNIDPTTHDQFNDLHMLFGSICALCELQLALPGELLTTTPLKSVLDRRPFI